MLTIISTSPEDTWRIGRTIGGILMPGDILCMYGELGSGKTNMAYGIAVGLGVQTAYVTSPTFTLVNEYSGRVPLYHMDLYRLQDDSELEELGFKEYLESEGVALIEWAELAENELPQERLSIYLSTVDEQIREIGFLAEGERYEDLLRSFQQLFNKPSV